jgi:hypothetical protein
MSLVFTDLAIDIRCAKHVMIMNMFQYSFTLWVLGAGRLTLNAKFITRGMVKSKLTSCCCLLLTTAEPGHLH